MAAMHDLNYLDNAELAITVRLTRRFRLRMATGLWLLRLAALVLPMEAHVRKEFEDR